MVTIFSLYLFLSLILFLTSAFTLSCIFPQFCVSNGAHDNMKCMKAFRKMKGDAVI